MPCKLKLVIQNDDPKEAKLETHLNIEDDNEEPADMAKILSKFMIKLKASGCSQDQRQEALMAGTRRFNKLILLDDSPQDLTWPHHAPEKYLEGVTADALN